MTSVADTTSNTVHFCSIRSARCYKRHGQFIAGSSCTKAKLKSQVLVLYWFPNQLFKVLALRNEY
jgi:hypothetical protein